MYAIAGIGGNVTTANVTASQKLGCRGGFSCDGRA